MHTIPNFDRDAIARRLFDEAICCPNFSLKDGLDVWLNLIEDLSGYLSLSCDQAQFYGSDINPGQISAMGKTINKAAKIALILADTLAAQRATLTTVTDD